MERPILNKELDSKTFRNYYFLKEELVNLGRENGMPTSESSFSFIAFQQWLKSNKGKTIKKLHMKCTNLPSSSTAVSYGCRQVDEYLDDENEVSKVIGITREEWHSSICTPIRYCLSGVVLTWIIVCKLLTYLFFYIKI